MVDANEYVKLQQGSKEEKDFRLATVAALFETGTAKITFFGEDTPSEKEYSYLSSYKPTLNDTVLLVPFSDTYIIVGKLLFKIAIAENQYITSDELNTILTPYINQDGLSLILEDYATKTDINGIVKDGGTITTLTISSEANLYRIRHTGTSLGFFNGSLVTKTSVNNIVFNATLTQAVEKLNELIDALQWYNLV
jgi:hypothetical protein